MLLGRSKAEPEQCGCRSDAEPGRPGVKRSSGGAERRAIRGGASLGLTDLLVGWRAGVRGLQQALRCGTRRARGAAC